MLFMVGVVGDSPANLCNCQNVDESQNFLLNENWQFKNTHTQNSRREILNSRQSTKSFFSCKEIKRTLAIDPMQKRISTITSDNHRLFDVKPFWIGVVSVVAVATETKATAEHQPVGSWSIPFYQSNTCYMHMIVLGT